MDQLKKLYISYLKLYKEGVEYSVWYVSGTLIFILLLYFTIPNQSEWLFPAVSILCLCHIYISGPIRAIAERKIKKY
ncbi:hypothetical protein GCM10022410_08300 [Amphibacillus indicireducens]|uniref:Uncharacterized protein n=1 Tax=Amphibacillus indicireducens TaxID=1076330 RepID=A0ABP7VBW1_9BACI